MRNMAFALFERETIRTTEAKAKELRRFVDQIITLGKSGTLHDRRRAFALMGNITGKNADGTRNDILKKVFTDLSKRLSKHKGGYTRMIKVGTRPGDAAPMVLLQLVEVAEKAAEGDGDSKKASSKGKSTKTRKKKAGESPEAQTAAAANE